MTPNATSTSRGCHAEERPLLIQGRRTANVSELKHERRHTGWTSRNVARGAAMAVSTAHMVP